MSVPTDAPFDIHVHIIGNGSAGTGCRLELRGLLRSLQMGYMERHMGLPPGTIRADLDRGYVRRLVGLTRRSSLGGLAILAMDFVHDERGCPLEEKSPFHVPNDVVLRLARRVPEFFAAVSIHPGRADALDELERCIGEGASLLKLLPNVQNVDCASPRYRRFWTRMADAGIAFLAHTGGEMSLPSRWPQYSDPARLQPVLDCGVKVIAAHASTSSTKLFDPDYFPGLVRLMRRWPNLYADNSALNSPIRSARLRDCLAPDIQDRMVHGSDVPIPISGTWAALRGLIPWSAKRRWDAHPNPLERDLQLKRAMGFRPDVFRRGWDIIRIPGWKAAQWAGHTAKAGGAPPS
jgi:hypothetical protein